MLSTLLFGLPAALTVLSLLVHSRFLTSPVLLFAMLPATLDWLCYALLAILSWQLARQDRRMMLLLVWALAIGAAGTAVAVARSYGDAVQTGMRGFAPQAPFSPRTSREASWDSASRSSRRPALQRENGLPHSFWEP
jgi:hypothetical protein